MFKTCEGCYYEDYILGKETWWGDPDEGPPCAKCVRGNKKLKDYYQGQEPEIKERIWEHGSKGV